MILGCLLLGRHGGCEILASRDAEICFFSWGLVLSTRNKCFRVARREVFFSRSPPMRVAGKPRVSENGVARFRVAATSVEEYRVLDNTSSTLQPF